MGHSTHPLDEFVALLRAHRVGAIADVRTIAKSRHNPQFGQDLLDRACQRMASDTAGWNPSADSGTARKDSINGAWRNASFRGYADYMQTADFAAAIQELVRFAAGQPTAIMCAEAVPWRCHRSLIGDALLVRGIEVLDIMSEKSAKPHRLTSFAKVEGETITYPPEDPAPAPG